MNYEYSIDYKMAYDGDGERRDGGEDENEENNRIKPRGIEWIRKKVENSGPPNVKSAHELRHFSEDRIRNFLEQLVKENEMDISLFLDKLSLISSLTERHYVNTFELFIHNTESCIGTNEECFRRSGNIAALIGSRTQEPANVIMIGCDFGIHGNDLIDYSPIPCGMLMDAMQTIIVSNLSFVNDIIFSYNIKGKKYTDDPYLFLLKTYRVNAFIKLSGSAGREILLSNDKSDMLIEYLNNVLDKPSNMLIPKILEKYLNKKLIQNGTEIEHGNLMELDIYYPKIYDSIMDFIQFKKVGAVQRVGENLLSFVYALSGIPYFNLKRGKFLGFNYSISDEYYGFPFLRSHIYDFGKTVHTVTFIFLTFIIFIISSLSFIYTCWHRKLNPKKLLVLYFTCIGSILGSNVVLYFLSSLFDYLPIQWNSGTSFLRNIFLHFLLTISMYFKFTENIESKFSIDYEQTYFTYGIFFPLLFLTIIFTADIVDTYFRAVMKEHFEGYKLLAAIFGFLIAFLISNLTFVSRNIIFDWGTSEYIPANDCPWLNFPEISQHRERYWQYSS
uniref:Uncharacterized protein n=1 Tax=Panagrolaimus superbus TaxID=310955 RepID=A0A914Z6Z1_9BILA